jgi:hypothetical protein
MKAVRVVLCEQCSGHKVMSHAVELDGQMDLGVAPRGYRRTFSASVGTSTPINRRRSAIVRDTQAGQPHSPGRETEPRGDRSTRAFVLRRSAGDELVGISVVPF